MKKLLLSFISFTLISVQAQKIKIKKDIIYIDKQEVGQIHKRKVKDSLASRKIKIYEIYDKNKQHVFDVGFKLMASPLYKKEKIYTYYTVKYVPTQKEAAINDKNFYLGNKKIVKYLYNNSLLDKNGVNMDGVEVNINMADSIPAKIKEQIEQEQQKLKDANLIVNREKKDPVFLEYISTENNFSFFRGAPVTTKKYAIYQGVLDPAKNFFKRKTLIGYLLIEYPRENTTLRYNDLVFLNINNIAVAKVNTFDYYMYFPYKEIPYKTRMNAGNEPYSTIFKTKSVLDKANMIITDLIKDNRL